MSFCLKVYGLNSAYESSLLFQRPKYKHLNAFIAENLHFFSLKKTFFYYVLKQISFINFKKIKEVAKRNKIIDYYSIK